MLNFLKRLFLRRVPRKIDSDYHKILSAHSSYYLNLNEKRKKEFRIRLFVLLNVLGFHSLEIKNITREMRAVIGCAIIEITFGLKNYLPTRFKVVVVKPRRYMYPGYGQPFLGHVDFNRGVIYFSWEDVKEGYLVPDDAVNVALHEMAHVIEIESAFQPIFGAFFNMWKWNEWAKLAYTKMHLIQNNQHQFLKSYGGQNMKEMFAVCVETFFEQPNEFKTTLPEIYQSMVDLLRQDPSIKGDPVIGRK